MGQDMSEEIVVEISYSERQKSADSRNPQISHRRVKEKSAPKYITLKLQEKKEREPREKLRGQGQTKEETLSSKEQVLD